MRLFLAFLKWFFGLAVLAVLGLAAWLYAAPPALIKLGAGYAAKIVCSNVLLAGRDADEVLRVDVQAPGHPLLRLMSVKVDEANNTVTAGLLGVFGRQTALMRGEGLGCSSVPDGDLETARAAAGAVPAATPLPDAPWPEGNRVDASQDPDLAAILDDPALVGPGMRAVVIVRDGRIVGERYGEGFSAETPLLGWSMTKTVTAAIIGTVVGDGKMAVADKDLFASWTDGRSAISAADLMAMSSGLEFNEEYGDVTDVTRMLYLEPDMAAYAVAKPLTGEIGSVFSYSSGTTLILTRLWQDRVGDERVGVAADKALRTDRHEQRGHGDGRARHFCRLVLPLRDGARLGPVRAIPASGRSLERQSDPAAGLRRMDARGGAGIEGRIWARPALAAGAGRRRAAWYGP